VVREPHRAVYDRETIYAILDEGIVCHVGFAVEAQPFVIPTMYARVGDAIYFHGSAASRMLRGASGGLRVCITVTLADGLVLARSVFNHSMNYRSVVALGKATMTRTKNSWRFNPSPKKYSRAAGTTRASQMKKSSRPPAS
jgi:nitroimidazol reductase NimA-like FMN-containing flavoprotein (pyridoxamine 5'-phosphate oxidase superfamily)